VRLRSNLFLVLAAALAVFAPRCFVAPPRNSAPLTQEAYVWQHVQNAGVQNAISEHGSAFRQITVLAAELSWPSHDPAIAPEITRIALKLPPPASCPSLGIAIRVHAYHGSFATDSRATRQLVTLARELVRRIETSGHRVNEFQIDFDAGESQLDAYRSWLEALRSSLAPIPVSFTALPSWLDHRGDFNRLARAADGFILQVHSLSLPVSPEALAPLCEPSAAMRAIRLAARAGVPFRVALPTYGYEAAFDKSRRFLGVSADGSARIWPEGAVLRTVRADSTELANLVSNLKQQHPASLTGFIWYRLPVEGEKLNWPWPTLAAVMNGRPPVANLHVESAASPKDASLILVTLTNSGEADAFQLPRTALEWSGARQIAADALSGFSLDAETVGGARLSPPAGFRLQPSASIPIGWLRFDHPPASFHATLLP
jgi:hypothetical protein